MGEGCSRGMGVGVRGHTVLSDMRRAPDKTPKRHKCDAFGVLPFIRDPVWLGEHKFWIGAAEKKNQDPGTKPY